MPEPLGEKSQNGPWEKQRAMVREEDQKFIDKLVEDGNGSWHLSPQNAALFRKVLFDMANDYLTLKRSSEDMRLLLKDNREFLLEDLRDVLGRYDFSEEDTESAAQHMAKILEEDMELKTDLDAAEDYLNKLKIAGHAHDDRVGSFGKIIFHNPRIHDVLDAMLLDEEGKLASLVPPDERREYLGRFRELYLDFLKAKRSGAEWQTSPEEMEFLTKYILKFAHEFLRTDVKKKKPA